MELKLTCANCATKPCCTQHEGVYLRPEEAYWMRLKYGKWLNIVKRENEVTHVVMDFLEFKNKRCPFLNHNLKCSIYSSRPRVCYFYPVDFRNLHKGKIKLMGSCEWVNQHRDKIAELMARFDAPQDPLREPDRRLYRLKVDIICEIFGFSRDIPRGNPHAKEEIKIW